MKLFLSLTAILEALTGFALIAAPVPLVAFLFGVPLIGAGAMTVAFIAGAAIITMAFFCWLSRKNADDFAIVKTMVVYNFAIVSIVIYGVINYQLAGIPLWLVVCFHLSFAIWAIMLIQKQQPDKNTVTVQKKQQAKSK